MGLNDFDLVEGQAENTTYHVSSGKRGLDRKIEEKASRSVNGGNADLGLHIKGMDKGGLEFFFDDDLRLLPSLFDLSPADDG
jgi:hypothetical protein